MIYQPRNVQPSGSSIDGNINNTFTMEVQTNSYVSAYQLLIVDFDNNNIYTGTKTTLAKNLYNGDTLSIPVNASSVKLSNGTNYKWRVRLYQPNSDMLITYGLVQSTSTTTNVYLQPNINIKAGMTLTINSQKKTIASYDTSTGLAVVSSAFSSAPSVGVQYQVYSDFIETIPDYIVYARENPTVSINNVPTSLTLKYHTFQGVYTQSDNVPIVYHQFDLYIKNDNGTNTLVNSSGKVYSANLSYTYDGFRTGNTYSIKLTVENDMGVIVDTDLYTFSVSYDIVEYSQQPLATFNDKNNAVQVSWVTPVENEATSFRSDAARGTVQSNDNTLTSVYLEPGQSIGDGDIVQITNSNYSLMLDGRSTQEVRSGKNLINLEKGYTLTQNGVTFKVNDDYSITLDGTCNKDNTTFSFNTSVAIPSAGAYTLSSKLVRGSISNTTNLTQIQILRSSDWAGIHLKLNNEDSSNTSQFSIGKYNACSIRIDNNVVLSNYTIKIQLEEGSTATDWEAFGLSPSPDYPSEIESVKGRNICDVSTSQIGVSWVLSTDSARAICNVRVMPNTTYSLSFENINGIDGMFFGEKVKSTDTSVIGGMTQITANRQITTTSTTNWLCIQFNKANISMSDIEAIKLQIEKGSAITNFVPFDNIQIINTGKNLFDEDRAKKRDNYNISLSNNYKGIEILLKPNTKYSISRIVDSSLSADTGYNLQFVKEDKSTPFFYLNNSAYSQNVINGTTTFITGNTGVIYLATLYGNDARLSTYFSNVKVQLEEGETVTFFEEYKSQTLNIDLQGNELCSIGDTKDILDISVTRDTKINKKIRKRIFNGTESWTLQSINSHDIANFQITLDDYVGGQNILAMCDRFSPQTTLIADTTNEGFHINASKILFIRIKKSRCSTVEEFKTWLSTHNVTFIYGLVTPEKIDLGKASTLRPIAGVNNMSIKTSLNTTFSLVYPYKTITGDAWDYTAFNPAGVKQTGVINYYDAAVGLGTFSSKQPFTYVPMKGDTYEITSNIYNASGFLYLYDIPYSTVNSLYTHGYTATWSTPDGLCVLPDDFNITLQFSPDSGFFYDENGVYKERVILVDTEVDGDGNSGRFQIIIDKNKIIFTQQPDISLESSFYTDKTQTFVLTETGVVQINSDYIWDDTATWNDNYTWTEGGTSIERVCNHWWKVQITNTSIRVEEIFPTQ